MKIVKKNLHLLLGVGLFLFGFFNFSHSNYSGGYYYDGEFIFSLVVGGILIAIGLLKKFEK